MYLILLILSMIGLSLIDYRYKLAFFYNKNTTYKILLITIGIFIIWDILGILLNIFFIGKTKYLLGLNIGEFPIEELFFLSLLSYNTLVVYRFLVYKRKSNV